jgi:hypothetical protein
MTPEYHRELEVEAHWGLHVPYACVNPPKVGEVLTRHLQGQVCVDFLFSLTLFQISVLLLQHSNRQ